MTYQLSNINQITFQQNMTFSDFLEQFQNYASPLLCIIDNKLHFYDKKEYIPKNIHPTTTVGNAYSFEDDVNGPLSAVKKYTVFGIDAARLFYPSFNIINIKPIIEYIKDENLIIYDHGKKYEFPRSNKNLEIRKGNVF